MYGCTDLYICLWWGRPSLAHIHPVPMTSTGKNAAVRAILYLVFIFAKNIFSCMKNLCTVLTAPGDISVEPLLDTFQLAYRASEHSAV